MLPRLRRYARSLARDGHEADDLLQDCVENAIASQGHWRGANLAGWMMAIMTNLTQPASPPATLRHLFRAGRSAEPASTAEPSDPLERDRLLGAIDALSPDQRAVLMLVVVEGYSYAEIAVMLDIPLGTVMSRLSRRARRRRHAARAQHHRHPEAFMNNGDRGDMSEDELHAYVDGRCRPSGSRRRGVAGRKSARRRRGRRLESTERRHSRPVGAEPESGVMPAALRRAGTMRRFDISLAAAAIAACLSVIVGAGAGLSIAVSRPRRRPP